MDTKTGSTFLVVLLPEQDDEATCEAFLANAPGIVAGFEGEERIVIHGEATELPPPDAGVRHLAAISPLSSGLKTVGVTVSYVDEMGQFYTPATGRRFEIPGGFHQAILNGALTTPKAVTRLFPHGGKKAFYQNGICSSELDAFAKLRQGLAKLAAERQMKEPTIEGRLFLMNSFTAMAGGFTRLGYADIRQALLGPKDLKEIATKKKFKDSLLKKSPLELRLSELDSAPFCAVPVRFVFGWVGYCAYHYLEDLDAQGRVVFCESCSIPLLSGYESDAICTSKTNPVGMKGFNSCWNRRPKKSKNKTRVRKAAADDYARYRGPAEDEWLGPKEVLNVKTTPRRSKSVGAEA